MPVSSPFGLWGVFKLPFKFGERDGREAAQAPVATGVLFSGVTPPVVKGGKSVACNDTGKCDDEEDREEDDSGWRGELFEP